MNNKKAGLVAAGALLAFLASSAQALTFTVTNGAVSTVAGASTVDFGITAINDTGPLFPEVLPSGTLGGITYSFSGGALFNFGNTSTLPNGISARPVGSTGNFWSIGTNPMEQWGPGIVSLGAGVKYYGFLWGSPDASSWNDLKFYNGSNQIGATLNGSAIMDPPVGTQTYARYFNIYADAGEVITSISFSASTNAFETDNHAFIAAIPEPETYAMLLAGLGLLGFVARRRSAVRPV